MQNFYSNLTEGLLVRVSNDTSNVIQVLESNYIDSNCLDSRERLIFQKSLLPFAFSVTPCYKSGYGIPHPDMIF